MSTPATHFDRYCKGCRQSLRGIESRRCPECGRAFDPNDPRTTHGPLRPAIIRIIEHSHKALLGLFTIIVLFCLTYTALGAEPLMLWIFGVLGIVVWAPLAGLMIGLSFVRGTSIGTKSRAASVLLPLLAISMAVTYWPMRVTFWLHRAELERLADQFENGTALPLPMQVGMYEVRRIDESLGNVGLHVRGAGIAGTHFVRRSPNSLPGPLGFNTNWEIYLGDDWYYVYED